MYIQESASAGFQLSSRIQTILATLAHALKIIGTDNDAARSDAQSDIADSGLERPLRYDIGEIDGDPRRTRSSDNPRSDEFRLWLHYPR